jgi:hypothetical protein
MLAMLRESGWTTYLWKKGEEEEEEEGEEMKEGHLGDVWRRAAPIDTNGDRSDASSAQRHNG